MLRTRIIPCLQLLEGSLVKTVRFDSPRYIGDPINTVRIFNELEVDELCFLDIRASIEGRSPDLTLLQNIADECFMPLSYGGGISNFETAQKILSIGFEKVVLNSSTLTIPESVKKISEHFGAQSIIGAIDIKKHILKGYHAYINSGTKKTGMNAVESALYLEELGVGELLVTSIDREGTWEGYDLELLQKVTRAVNIPVIANGGAGKVEHLSDAVKKAGASAVALGSMVVYQNKGMGVLINFPGPEKLQQAF